VFVDCRANFNANCGYRISAPCMTCNYIQVSIVCTQSMVHKHKFRCQVTMATAFRTMVPNICGSSVRNLLHVTLLAPTILRFCIPGNLSIPALWHKNSQSAQVLFRLLLLLLYCYCRYPCFTSAYLNFFGS